MIEQSSEQPLSYIWVCKISEEGQEEQTSNEETEEEQTSNREEQEEKIGHEEV